MCRRASHPSEKTNEFDDVLNELEVETETPAEEKPGPQGQQYEQPAMNSSDFNDRLEKQKDLFDDFCEEWLELDKEHLDENGMLAPFDYFIKVLKTAFFWKKVIFFKTRESLVAMRRKELMDKGHPQIYKQITLKIE